jgi:hypothetical protein
MFIKSFYVYDEYSPLLAKVCRFEAQSRKSNGFIPGFMHLNYPDFEEI